MKDVSGYATREISPTMEAFADYLVAEVFGGALPDGIEEASFRKGVALGGSTRGYFQASERWKSDPRNYLANVEANREVKALAKADAAKVALAKATERVAKAEEAARVAVEAAKARLAALAPEADENAADAADAALEDAADLESRDGRTADESADESADEVPNPATVGRRSRNRAA